MKSVNRGERREKKVKISARRHKDGKKSEKRSRLEVRVPTRKARWLAGDAWVCRTMVLPAAGGRPSKRSG